MMSAEEYGAFRDERVKQKLKRGKKYKLSKTKDVTTTRNKLYPFESLFFFFFFKLKRTESLQRMFLCR